jgi:predicted RNA-binding Zn ribbon-like protein
MSEIPTAQEILEKNYRLYTQSSSCSAPIHLKENIVKMMSSSINGTHPQVDAMIEFAKLHCEAQIREICHQMDLSISNELDIVQKIVENAYPLENIK